MSAAELDATPPAEVFELIEAWRRREKRADLRAGQVCAILAEVNRDSTRKATPFHPADFFPSLAEDRASVTDDELEQKLDALASFGG